MAKENAFMSIGLRFREPTVPVSDTLLKVMPVSSGLDDNDEPSKSATVKVWKREEYKAKDQKF
jgi:hypothetical protein